MGKELTCVKSIDGHRIRIYKDRTYQNVLGLISSPGGITTTVQGGSGLHATETATPQYLIEKTSHGQAGQPGADSGSKPYRSTTV